MTLKEYRLHSVPDGWTNAWRGIDRTSGKHRLESPEDYIMPACVDPRTNCIIVMGAGEEKLHWMRGSIRDAYSIDAWGWRQALERRQTVRHDLWLIIGSADLGRRRSSHVRILSVREAPDHSYVNFSFRRNVDTTGLEEGV